MNLNEENIAVSVNVNDEMERLRITANLKTLYIYSYLNKTQNLKITYFNIQSLNAYLNDLKHDFLLLQSDIIICLQTRLKSMDESDDLSIPHFKLYRCDYDNQSTTRSPYGLVIYVQTGIKLMDIKCYRKSSCFEILSFNVEFGQIFNIIALYRSPKIGFHALCEELNAIVDTHIPIIIMGDFYINALEDTSDIKNEIFSQTIFNG